MRTENWARQEPVFRWVQVAHGWISFALDGGSGRYRCTVSDTSDVPAELLSAIEKIIRGSRLECVSFDHEPSEIRWTLAHEGDAVRVTVESYENWGSSTGGYLEWVGSWVDTASFGRSFLEATESFLRKVGKVGFTAGWPTYSAPAMACEKLRASIRGDH